MRNPPPGTYPSTEFFRQLLDKYSHKLTLSALTAWSIDPEWVKPLKTYRTELAMDKMDIYSKSLFIANVCSKYKWLYKAKLLDDEELARQLSANKIEQDIYYSLVTSL